MQYTNHVLFDIFQATSIQVCLNHNAIRVEPMKTNIFDEGQPHYNHGGTIRRTIISTSRKPVLAIGRGADYGSVVACVERLRRVYLTCPEFSQLAILKPQATVTAERVKIKNGGRKLNVERVLRPDTAEIQHTKFECPGDKVIFYNNLLSYSRSFTVCRSIRELTSVHKIIIVAFCVAVDRLIAYNTITRAVLTRGRGLPSGKEGIRSRRNDKL